MERQEIMEQGQDNKIKALATSANMSFWIDEQMRELEAENARLKSLVGELLVTNQLLRECKEQVAEMKGLEIMR